MYAIPLTHQACARHWPAEAGPTGTPLTDHARSRLQQRGIPPQVLDVLLDYGHWQHDRRGADIVWFDHRARQALKRRLPRQQYRLLEDKLNAYAVVGADGAIITVGYRDRRINH